MRILVADDAAISRRVICSFLRELGHEVVSVNDGEEALEALRSDGGISVALIDWMMPGLDGIEVCRQMRAMPGRSYTYMISVTSKSGKQDLVYALQAGYDDFLSKPVQPAELNARLLVARRIVDLQEKLLLACELSQFKAAHDTLTGLWNRGATMDFLRVQLAIAEREASDLALLMVDIDHFKKVNDTYGHPVGDSVLIHIAQLMSSVVRASDWVGRYGGEEFLIVASKSPAGDAIQMAERLRLAVAEDLYKFGEQAILATVSIGVAIAREGSRHSQEELVTLADSAMYRAKHEGRNRVEVDSDAATTSASQMAPI